MSRPSVIPTWATGGSAIVVQPDSAKIAAGWANNGKVEAGFLNWLANLAGQWIAYLDGASNAAVYGDGSDGAGVADGVTALAGCTLGGGNYTATRDLFFTDLTISNGVLIFPTTTSRIYVNGTLTTVAGVGVAGISSAGVSASGATGGAAGGVGSLFNGSGGANGGTSGNPGSNSTQGGGGFYSGGGTGGVGGTGAAGANAAGTVTFTGLTAAQGSPRVPSSMQSGVLYGSSGALLPLGGCGGAGGGGGSAGSGGGGGGGAGGLVVAARVLNIGTGGGIFATGGAGGNAPAGNGGGGGGGGGGFIQLTYHQSTGTVTPSSAWVAGGAGGAKNGTGVNGSAGANGTLYVLIA